LKIAAVTAMVLADNLAVGTDGDTIEQAPEFLLSLARLNAKKHLADFNDSRWLAGHFYYERLGRVRFSKDDLPGLQHFGTSDNE